MRLLSRSNGTLIFTDRTDEPYAILSHTWGSEQDELSYKDIADGAAFQDKQGWQKVDFCLRQALAEGVEHVWIDSCCIDRRDKNELGEAINLMYEFYAQAEVCLVYLQDVPSQGWQQSFESSRWFTRGWTLQELLAPGRVKFFTRDEEFIGDRDTLWSRIKDSTGIDKLPSTESRSAQGQPSLVERFKWSLNRQTTKPEDKSYCVLGLLEVNLIPNYGEGEEAARERLFKEVEEEHGRRNGRGLRQAFLEKQAAAKAAATKSLTPRLNKTAGPAEEKALLMKMLWFDDMHARQGTISEPFPGTCTWLLNNNDYQKWYDMTGLRFLWIKGKPGAGKSTLVKYAYSEACTQASGAKLSFFFNARGSTLEKTNTGLFRSLLWQLLQYLPSVQSKVLSKVPLKPNRAWNLLELQAAFRFAVTQLEEPARCYIDALDECTVAEVQDIVDCLENIARMPRGKLYICFASRFYPSITINCSVQLLLGDQLQHAEDLVNYVNARLAVEDDTQGRALRQKVIDKANGVFLWAVLVIRLLNKELSSGSIFNVQRRLDEMPDELNELLRQIVKQEAADIDQFRLCLQWLLFSPWPLGITEYYHAIVTGLCELGLADPSAYLEPWSSSRVSADHMTRFVSSSSRGLAEVNVKGVVQFIHESVRDLFLKHSGLQTLFQEVPEAELHCRAHQSLRDISLRYTAVKAEPSNCLQDHPLLGVAAVSAVYHADQAALQSPQTAFFDHAEQLRAVCQLLRQYMQTHGHSYSYSLKVDGIANKLSDLLPEAQYVYSDEWTIVQVLAMLGASRLIHTAHELGNPVSHCRGPPPLHLAVRHRSEAAALALLDCGADVDERWEGNTALHTCYYGGAAEMCSLLLKHGADLEARNSSRNTPLLQALDHGAPIQTIRWFLNNGANVNARGECGRTCLMHLAGISPSHALTDAEQNVELLRMFLDHGADINAKDDDGWTALMQASRSGRESLVEELLRHKADRSITDKEGRTALDHATEPDWETIVSLLRTTTTFDRLAKIGLGRQTR